MSLDTEFLSTVFFLVLLRCRVLLYGEIKRYKSPIRIFNILNAKYQHYKDLNMTLFTTEIWTLRRSKYKNYSSYWHVNLAANKYLTRNIVVFGPKKVVFCSLAFWVPTLIISSPLFLNHTRHIMGHLIDTWLFLIGCWFYPCFGQWDNGQI